MDSSSETSLKELLVHLGENWDNPAAHESFLSACEACGKLAFAAQEYRKIAEDSADSRAPLAQEKLSSITARALLVLDASRTVRKDGKKVITWLAVCVSATLILLCLYLVSR